jgi:DNA polymerase (family 10)
MPLTNRDLADQFEEIGDLLEIQGANVFRVRAYRNAARTLRDLPQSVVELVQQEADLTELPGIGKDLAQQLQEAVADGEPAALSELKEQVPEGLVAVKGVAGLGPKRTQTLYKQLGIDDLDKLRKAAEGGRIRELSGFGKKTEQKILHELATRGSGETRIRLRDAEGRAEPLVDYLRRVDGVETVTIAGSYRRRKETVGDLDILVVCSDDSPLVERFVGYADVREVLSQGTTRSSVILKGGLQVDLRVVPAESYGAALHYFTGSKDHNVRVRQMAIDRGLKVNEYGVWDGETQVAGRTEQEVYAAVELPVIPPELREARGEFEAARDGRLPELIALEDIRGNLHGHTTWSDGAASARAMAEAARERGWAYIAITDHSQAVRVANGLDADRLARQIDEIDALNEELDGLTLLKGIEVDILEDGSLDLPDDVLESLDIRVGAVHSRFNLARDKQTDRIRRALDGGLVDILAHPTGRLIGSRAGYALDLERVIAKAAEVGCALEINAQPARLDLDDTHARMAIDAGVKLSIATDAHAEAHYDLMRYGIDQARRAWVSKADVLNTRSLKQLRQALKR